MAEALWDGFSRAVSRQLRKAAATRSLKGRGKAVGEILSCHSPRGSRTHTLRTLLPLPFFVFADAAFARGCGVVFAVKQHVSPNRPLKVGSKGQIQSTPLPQPGTTNGERDLAAFREEIMIDCFFDLVQGRRRGGFELRPCSRTAG